MYILIEIGIDMDVRELIMVCTVDCILAVLDSRRAMPSHTHGNIPYKDVWVNEISLSLFQK